MDDLSRLIAAFDSKKLLRPDPLVPNSVDLARVIATWAGLDGLAYGHNFKRIESLIGNPRQLVFVLVDGLGMNLLERLPVSSFLRRNLAIELRSVFPSTTAVGLTSYATGKWPSQHGITSWFVHLPEINDTATILPFIRSSDKVPLEQLGITSAQAFPESSLYPRFDIDTLAVQPTDVVNSTYSKYWMGKWPGIGYRRQQFHKAINRIADRSNVGPPNSYTYFYIDFVDKAAHKAGTFSEKVLKELERLDCEISKLAASVGPDCRIVLSSDHGHLDFNPETEHFIDPGSSLRNMLRAPPAHDARVIFFHVRRGFGGRFQEAFSLEHGDDFVLLSADQVEALGLLGPGLLSDVTRARIGDFIGISLGEPIIWYRHVAEELRFKSLHSGLSHAEMRIPMVVA